MEHLLSAIVRGDETSWPWADADSEQEALFLDTACRHGIQALVARQLRKAGVLDSWPPSIRAALARVAVQRASVDQLLRQEVARVLAALARAGIRPLLIKGTALAYTHYAHPCLRPRGDTDLLVRDAEVVMAMRVMEDLGYRRHNQVSGELVTCQSAFIKGDRHRVQHVYDIHWKIADPQLFANLLSVDELEPSAVGVPALGEHARAIGDVHALLLACVHRVAHHNDSENLMWIYDIHLLASSMDEEQLRRFARLAADRNVKAICARGLALADQWFHTGLSGNLVAELGGRSDRREPSETYLRSRLRKVDILLSDLRALPEWRGRLKLLREHLFPPATYMLQSYAASSRALLPALYTHRFVRGACRWFRPL